MSPICARSSTEHDPSHPPCPGRSAARSGALLTRDPGCSSLNKKPGSRICGASRVRCTACGTRNVCQPLLRGLLDDRLHPLHDGGWRLVDFLDQRLDVGAAREGEIDAPLLGVGTELAA